MSESCVIIHMNSAHRTQRAASVDKRFVPKDFLYMLCFFHFSGEPKAERPPADVWPAASRPMLASPLC